VRGKITVLDAFTSSACPASATGVKREPIDRWRLTGSSGNHGSSSHPAAVRASGAIQCDNR
jgi:hypothetical protein